MTRGGGASPSDISYPQCNGTFPSDAAFAIVGVNVGIVYSPNPCLTSELAWAGMDAALYANTANPGAHFLLPLADRANPELFDARPRSVTATVGSVSGRASVHVIAAPPPGLTRYGQTIWNLEALLHDAFGSKTVYLQTPRSPRKPRDFSRRFNGRAAARSTSIPTRTPTVRPFER